MTASVLKYFYPLKTIKFTHENPKILAKIAAKCLFTFQQKSHALPIKVVDMPEHATPEWLTSVPVRKAFQDFSMRANINPTVEYARKETSVQYKDIMKLALTGLSAEKLPPKGKAAADEGNEKDDVEANTLNPRFAALRSMLKMSSKEDPSEKEKDPALPTDPGIVGIVQHFYPKATKLQLGQTNRAHFEALAAALTYDFQGRTNNALGLKPSVMTAAITNAWVASPDVQKAWTDYLAAPAASMAFEKQRKDVMLAHMEEFNLAQYNLSPKTGAVDTAIAVHTQLGRQGVPITVKATTNPSEMTPVSGPNTLNPK